MKRPRFTLPDARFFITLMVMICYVVSVFTKEAEEFKEIERIVMFVLAFYFGSQSGGNNKGS